MRSFGKPRLFIITGIIGLAVASSIIGISLYQYVNLNMAAQSLQQYGLVTPSVFASAQTNYIIIIASAVPLVVLSSWLLHRTTKRIKHSRQKGAR
ncbi:MAG: hypothetical protein M1348_00860 [Candidatus Parvarchaeota archaeon]|jgi:hypothetical protein|nr:hypothetical protein [Candidatus Parvarchaeota archaeon]MCL5101147.1 hypothetical protein [Candidatus Parvarchaeota archaeon]